MFVREPLPGIVKTRLASTLGPAGAAALYRAFVDDMCARLAPRLPLALAAESSTAGVRVAQIARRYRLPVLDQGAGDLGARMRRVAETAFARARRVVLIGSDLPTIPVAHVTGALGALGRARVVLGPSLDGGYYLLGLRRPLVDVFTGIPWSTDRVLARTLARLARARVRPRFVPCWYDVDTAADVELLRRHLATLAVMREDPCPRTRRALARASVPARRRSVAR